MKRLHIGCGKAYLRGWTNIDIFSDVKADLHCSAMGLPYSYETFDLIYASHVLEHFGRNLVKSALVHWYGLLKKGGTLRLSVPNFDAIVAYYTQGSPMRLKELLGLLYGGQDNLLNYHHMVFNLMTLTELLESVGFKDVQYWDWRETDHGKVDDYSQAYLPHMDKAHGMIMSLNLEAVK